MRNILGTHKETIIAQCTPRGSGALALLRLSGDDALEIANQFAQLQNSKKIVVQKTHTISYGSVVDKTGDVIDTVMFIVMHAPKTFTGQNTVEITCHNNQIIIEEIISRAIECGARLALPGEFAQRAVLNNKLDVVQAEAINEVIHANTQQALKASLSAVTGSFSNVVNDLEKHVIKAIGFCEASFEFIDEEITFEKQINEILTSILNQVAILQRCFDQAKQIRNGIRIALVGSVNAGKSSLFNALLRTHRAIVTNIPGTTRDSIEAGIYLNKTYCTLVDTAGLRETDDTIEQQGIQRSLQEAETADIVLLVFDNSKPLTDKVKIAYNQLLDKNKKKTIIIGNKIDLPFAKNKFPKDITVSTKTNQNILNLETLISKKINQTLLSGDTPFLLNTRQYNLLCSFAQKITFAQTLLQTSPEYEIISYHLNDALRHLCELTGKEISEQSMDAIFRQFCVGK